MTDSQRVLVLPPTGRDATLTGGVLAKAGIECHVCADLEDLCRELEAGAGAVLVTDEVAHNPNAVRLVQAIAQQPPWSDVPVLLVSRGGVESAAAAFAEEHLGNVAVLERPVRMPALVSAVRTALRARRRQYLLRDEFEYRRTTAETLAQQYRKLSDGQRRLRLALETGRLGSWQVDLATGTLECSTQGKEHFGRGPDDPFTYADLIETIHPDDRERVRDAIRDALGQRTDYEAEYRVVRPDGETRWILARGRGVEGLDGSPERMVGVTLDVTERRRAEQELREADRRKDEFIALLAHELRNPLAPVRNVLHALRLTADRAGAADPDLDVMERQVGQMVRLIDDLLDVSRITRGKLDLHRETVELASVVALAVETSRPVIEAAGHHLTVVVPPERLVLSADPARLAQVLANLLNNAAKYTERGGRVRLEVAREGAQAVVRVRDSGVGIPPDMLGRVFEKFTQVDRASGLSQGGLGLGLTLVKSLVVLHGGSVEAHSDGPGRGSEFVVRLPLLADAEAPPAAPARTPAAAPPAAGRRVLVADDNVDAANTLAALLKMFGHTVRVAHDGLQALDAARDFRPDVALLDIGMPGMTGHEVARRMRADPDLAATRLVALTGWGQADDRRQSREAGFDDHLVKPVDSSQLQAALVQSGPM